MPTTTFHSNEQLWKTVTVRVNAARRVHAAIAYFGKGGADLLRLGCGDRLVVDMSPATVKSGSTDPREIVNRQSICRTANAADGLYHAKTEH